MRGWRGSLLVFLFLLFSGMVVPGQELDFDQVQADEEFRGGVRAFHNGYYNEAIQSFKKALSFKPRDRNLRLWLGRAFFQSGLTEAALAEWQALSEAGEGSPLLDGLLEILQSRRGIGRELGGAERWVVSGEIGGTFGETTYFQRPTAVRSRRDGSFYLVGFVTNRVILLDTNGLVKKTLGGGLGGFDHPFDIVEDKDGSVFISEFKGDRIAKCDGDGNRLLSFGGTGRGPGNLVGPQYLALDENGNLYVSDWGNRRVSKFSGEGDFLHSFGGPRGAYPGLEAPTGIIHHQERVYVADDGRKELAVFDSSGNYLSSILHRRLASFEGISLLPQGGFMLSDGQRLYRYDLEEDRLSLLSDFGGLAQRILSADQDANGNLLAPDFDAGVVHVLSELTGMHAGLSVMIRRIEAQEHPKVVVEAHVSNRYGDPVVGLSADNFVVSENKYRIDRVDLDFAAYKSARFALALMTDLSSEMRARRPIIERIARDTAEKIGGTGDFHVISSGPAPTVVSRPGDPVVAMARAAADREESYGPHWAFDLGVRLAVSELSFSRDRKALLFISSGDLPKNAFTHYGLQETADYMKNNSVAFYPIYLDDGKGSDELEYLARETGGRSYPYFQPLALTGLAEDLRAQVDGTYVLEYRSPSPTDFGRAFIPLEIEAFLVRKSGRDEAGYFAPLEF